MPRAVGAAEWPTSTEARPWPVDGNNSLWVPQTTIDARVDATHRLRTALFRLNNTRQPPDMTWYEDNAFMCDALSDALRGGIGLRGVIQALVWPQLPLKRTHPPSARAAPQAEDAFFTGRHFVGTWAWRHARRSADPRAEMRRVIHVAATHELLVSNALGSATMHGLVWTELLATYVRTRANESELWPTGLDLCDDFPPSQGEPPLALGNTALRLHQAASGPSQVHAAVRSCPNARWSACTAWATASPSRLSLTASSISKGGPRA